MLVFLESLTCSFISLWIALVGSLTLEKSVFKKRNKPVMLPFLTHVFRLGRRRQIKVLFTPKRRKTFLKSFTKAFSKPK